MAPGRRALIGLVIICSSVSGLRAEEPAIDGRKQARAARIAGGPIRLDGRLDEEAWQQAAPISEFLQAEPVEGAPPTDAMEVRFLFDDSALWVGARMRSGPGVAVQAPMSRRDDGSQAEYLQIELDTYLDRRTAYMFGVTASGVRLDHYHPSDNEDDTDAQFDPVWEARTHVDAAGWTAELWMPFSQLRFNDQRAASLGPERQAMAAAVERGELLGGGRAHRKRLVVAVRRAARHRRCAADAPVSRSCRTSPLRRGRAATAISPIRSTMV